MLRVSRLIVVLALCLFAFTLSAFLFTNAQAQQKDGVRITWTPQPGVSRYRLQVATDPDFSDIVFDRAVSGSEYTILGLPKRSYYWHVAPAVKETGRFLSTEFYDPVRPVVVNSPPTRPQPVYTVKDKWRVVSQYSLNPLVADVNQHGSVFLAATDNRGYVYGFDGLTGTALWSFATTDPGLSRASHALINSGTFRVLILMLDRKLVAIDAGTGQRLWDLNVPSGIDSISTNAAVPEVLVATNKGTTLMVIDAVSGRSISEFKLTSPIVGSAATLITPKGIVRVVTERNRKVEMFDSRQVKILTMDPGVEPLGSPVVLSESPIKIAIPFSGGLVGLEGDTLLQVWKAEVPDWQISGFHVLRHNDDRPFCIVAMTRHGLKAIDANKGKVLWGDDVEPGTQILGTQDLNQDGWSDAVVANAGNISIFSGVDGSRLYQPLTKPVVERGRSVLNPVDTLTAPAPGGSAFWLFSSDPGGLKAAIVIRDNRVVASTPESRVQ